MTSLSPELIEFQLTEGSGWVVDEKASTPERTVLYYTKPLASQADTPALCEAVRISNDIYREVREEIVEEVLGEALQKMDTRHPEFKIRASIPDEIIMLPMDALLIEQVIINLLENALLHSGSKEPVDVIVKNGTECATFIVRDYGQGIPEEVLAHLFDISSLMEDLPDARKKTGIGLLICKTIISAHHGTLTGHNHSLGAEFIFTLPKRSQ